MEIKPREVLQEEEEAKSGGGGGAGRGMLKGDSMEGVLARRVVEEEEAEAGEGSSTVGGTRIVDSGLNRS